MRLIFTFFLMVVFSVAVAQKKPLHTTSKKAKKSYQEAGKMYGMRFYTDAKTLVKDAIKYDTNFLEAHVLLGEMYLDKRKYSQAAAELNYAIELDSSNDIPVIYRMVAEAELHDLQLKEAIDHVEEYKNIPGVSEFSKQKAEDLIQLALFRKHMVDNPVPYYPINLGGNINSEWYEHSPTLTVDEKTLYFTRKQPYDQRNGKNFFDENLYRSKKDENGDWGVAVALGNEINTQYIEGASSISPDGKYLFFTRCKSQNCDIYIAHFEDGEWTKARSLGGGINTPNWESQPSFATDGRTLYFVRRVGRKNQRYTNIYKTIIQENGLWSKPVGISINTSGSEESPYLHPDGETFYFTSDGYPGLGGRDLFMAKIDSNGEFGAPVNLGYPINSGKDEVSLIVSPNGERAFFASGMKDGFGKWDLYSFELPVAVRPIPVRYSKGLVYDMTTKEPVGAKFEIIDLVSGNIVVESFSDHKSGKFLVTIPTGKDYLVNVSADGYLFFSANFNIGSGDDTTVVSIDVPLSPINTGEAIVLKNVFFEFNSYELKELSKIELGLLVELLNKNPQMNIEIGGHTDNKGTRAYNLKLSENRAKSVYEYLISQGIEKSRLSFKGYYFSQPIATNDTSEGRAVNRRTEFKILEIEGE